VAPDQPPGSPSRRTTGRDVLAGVTVTAYLVPQVMAYAGLAGLPPETGLWAAVAALAAYALLGSSPQLSVGPESTTALMTGAALAGVAVSGEADPDAAAALALAVGAVCLLGWLGGLAFLADLLSRPVLVGYMAGIAGIMILSQAGRASGAEIPVDGPLRETAWLARHPGEIHGATFAVFGATLVVLLVGSALWPRGPMVLLGVLAAGGAVALLGLEHRGVEIVGEIDATLPAVYLPDLGSVGTAALLAPALAVAVVGFTDNILTARSFAARHADRIDARRELLALGAANVAAGLVHGLPVSSSGSRTAIVDAVGGRTRIAAATTVVATLVALLTLRPVLASFPEAALGAVVVYAGLRLVELGEFRRITSFRRTELLIALVTTGSVLTIGVLEGVLIAVGLSLLDILRRVARPHDAVEGLVPGLAGMHDVDDYPTAEVVPGLLVYRYDAPLFFANAENFLARVRAEVDGAAAPVRWLLLNTEAMSEIDLTGADALETLRSELARRGIVLALARVKQDLRDTLEPTGLLGRIGDEHVFVTLPTAVAAFREATDDHGQTG